MMHVLSVLYFPVYGGPHNRNARLAPILAAKNIRTTVLLPDEAVEAAQRLRNGGVEVVTMPLRRIRATKNVSTHLRYVLGFPGQVSALRKLMKELAVDVVQINGLVNAHPALAAHGLGIPVVWQILDTYTPVPLRKLIAPLVRRYADVVMCTGHQVADEHPGTIVDPDRLVTFFPPVNVRQFKPDAALRASAREALALDASDFVVGTVGNINPQKGHDSFVRAAAALKKQLPHAKFVILGSEPDNHRDYMKGLWKLADDLGLELGRDLISREPTGRVHELLQALDVFWMTPKPFSEGIPTAMEEAMAVGLPVVSFDVGSIGELVQDGRSGYLVSNQDPAAVAELTIRHLLAPEQRAQMGEMGRQFIEAHASVERCAETHIRAYELAKNGRAPQRQAVTAGAL
jgi:glycosyltransferase involved in cell wall biosynthesis